MTPAKATNIATATVKDPLDPRETLTSTDTQTVSCGCQNCRLVKTVDKPVVYPDTWSRTPTVARNLGATPFEGPTDRNAWIDDHKCPTGDLRQRRHR